MKTIGNHEDVFEFDGAFKCLKCKKDWGALPGKPEMPKECKKSWVSKRLEKLDAKIKSLEEERTLLRSLE